MSLFLPRPAFSFDFGAPESWEDKEWYPEWESFADEEDLKKDKMKKEG